MNYRRAWMAWALGSAVSFLVLEMRAARSDEPNNTLSAHLRLLLGIEPKRPHAILATSAFAGSLTWLGVHIIFGIWPTKRLDRPRKDGGYESDPKTGLMLPKSEAFGAPCCG